MSDFASAVQRLSLAGLDNLVFSPVFVTKFLPDEGSVILPIIEAWMSFFDRLLIISFIFPFSAIMRREPELMS